MAGGQGGRRLNVYGGCRKLKLCARADRVCEGGGVGTTDEVGGVGGRDELLDTSVGPVTIEEEDETGRLEGTPARAASAQHRQSTPGLLRWNWHAL